MLNVNDQTIGGPFQSISETSELSFNGTPAGSCFNDATDSYNESDNFLIFGQTGVEDESLITVAKFAEDSLYLVLDRLGIDLEYILAEKEYYYGGTISSSSLLSALDDPTCETPSSLAILRILMPCRCKTCISTSLS